MPGNQYNSPKADLMAFLCTARDYLAGHDLRQARYYLNLWRSKHGKAPASTRRRWRCGY